MFTAHIVYMLMWLLNWRGGAGELGAGELGVQEMRGADEGEGKERVNPLKEELCENVVFGGATAVTVSNRFI